MEPPTGRAGDGVASAPTQACDISTRSRCLQGGIGERWSENQQGNKNTKQRARPLLQKPLRMKTAENGPPPRGLAPKSKSVCMLEVTPFSAVFVRRGFLARGCPRSVFCWQSMPWHAFGLHFYVVFSASGAVTHEDCRKRAPSQRTGTRKPKVCACWWWPPFSAVFMPSFPSRACCFF